MNEYLKYADGDRDFAGWLRDVDTYVKTALWVSIFDLRDLAWRSMYDDGYPATDAAQDIIDNPHDYL